MNKFNTVILILLALLILQVNSLAAKHPYGQIESFQAQDAPYDDGAGIMLSWKPLPKDMRIIQYRIYRGINPDTLYSFGQVEVDAAAGVVTDKMYYYDKDFQMLLTIDSPARLKKEKQQAASSPLYGKIPRDPAILSKLLPYLTMLGIVDQGNFYKHSRLVKDKDGNVSAGLKCIQFEQVAANPKSGHRYYYTVLAVDEKGTFLPYCPIQSAVPVDNPPDNTATLTSLFVKDTGAFQFEWTPPASSYDIAQWQIWLMPKSQLSAFNQWQNVYQAKGGAPAPWTKNAILLAEKPFDYNNYLTLTTQGGKIVNPDGSAGPVVLLTGLDQYMPVLAVQDYSGMASYAMGASLRTLTTADLPKKAIFGVADKPDDKGDTNTLSFGKPVCFVTQANYLNAKRDRVRINYELSENMQYKVLALRFLIMDKNGKQLALINEPYPDKIITLKLAKATRDADLLQVKIAFLYKGTKVWSDYYVQQNLSFDYQTKRFNSDDLFYFGEDLTRNYYQILRKNELEMGFMPNKKISTISRNYDDIVNYETTLQKLISGVDVKSGRLLVDPNLNFALDKNTGMPLSINIYRNEQLRDVKKMQSDLADLRKQLAAHPQQADSLNQVIAQNEAYLKALLSNPDYKAATDIKNPWKWLSFLHKVYLKNYRSYSYMIMKTDNAAAYTLSDISKPYIPISNWFSHNYLLALIASLIFTIIVLYASFQARRGKHMYLRPIAGLQEIDNAVGRATEMGRPILYVPGWSSIGEITTIASMMILNRVARKAAEYDTRILVPNSDYYVMPLAQEMVRDAFYEAGRPDSFNPVDVFYVSSDQFPYAAGVNGTMIREKSATNFFMGFFNAEALLMTETGNSIGSIQIAGTDAITQVPFFITTCDYTLIGEEFYAGSAYLSQDPELVSMLKAQDYFKFLIVFFILAGAILATLHFNWLTNAFPLE